MWKLLILISLLPRVSRCEGCLSGYRYCLGPGCKKVVDLDIARVTIAIYIAIVMVEKVVDLHISIA